MENKSGYLLINKQILPDIFVKVVEAKNLLERKKTKTVNEALEQVKISRTAFYKYKDYVFDFNDINRDKIITLFFVLDDVSGILSEILAVLAKNSANVLTINQNIPVNSIANITISIRTDELSCDIDGLIDKLKKISGVNKIGVIARE